MKVQILGTGCAKCKNLEKNALDAVAELQADIEVVKIDDIKQIMEMGVMMTPALAIDNDVKSTGR